MITMSMHTIASKMPRPQRSLAPKIIAASLFLCIGSQAANAEFVVGRIDAKNFATHHVGGPDAIAGIDDWFLSNGTICAAVSAPHHMSAIAPQGGVLIDLGHCGADDDQWTVLQPILNLSLANLAPVTSIQSGIDDKHAWIQTRSVTNGVELLTTYSLDNETPTALGISIEAKRIEKGDRLYSIGSVVLHPSGQTPAFSILQSDFERSLGFTYPSSSGQSARELMKSFASSDLNVLVGGDEMPPISYGVERVSATVTSNKPGKKAKPLASFSVTGTHFTLFNLLTKPLWIKRKSRPPGLLQLMQLPFMDVKLGTSLSSDSRIWVGPRADVASITNQIWTDATLLHGTIDDASARIHFHLSGHLNGHLNSHRNGDLTSDPNGDFDLGAPVTEIRPNPDGSFEVRLPKGSYTARVLGSANRSTTLAFKVETEGLEESLPPLILGAPGWAQMPEGFIGRLIFLDQNGSTASRFGDNYLGLRIGKESIPSGLEAPFVNLAQSPVDPKRVPLSPGQYRVIATRGPEYEAKETVIEIRAGVETPILLQPLARVAPTPGWMSADLHVHSGVSFDSSLPQVRQIAAFAASGAEILVATEHDRIFDPRPAIRESGLIDQLVSITGMEVTSAVGGIDSPYASAHLNAFPVTPKIGEFRNGAPSLARQRLRDTFAEIRTINPDSFIQLNHPRSFLDEPEDDTYFGHLGEAGQSFEPTRPLTESPNNALIEIDSEHGLRDIDFHGVELLNEKSLLRYRRTRADWFSLLLHGERIVGTSNSDSHRQGAIVGLPRTYVQLKNDSLATFSQTEFMSSLRAGRAFGTTGPFVQVHLDQAGLGDLHSGSIGTLHIRVDAADWIPVSEWRAYVNGALVFRGPIAAGQEATLPLAFEVDSFVTVEVEGPAEGLYAETLPDFIPFAFTNPIFVDVDGNGHFDAPGLSEQIPSTMTNPDQPD